MKQASIPDPRYEEHYKFIHQIGLEQIRENMLVPDVPLPHLP